MPTIKNPNIQEHVQFLIDNARRQADPSVGNDLDRALRGLDFAIAGLGAELTTMESDYVLSVVSTVPAAGSMQAEVQTIAITFSEAVRILKPQGFSLSGLSDDNSDVEITDVSVDGAVVTVSFLTDEDSADGAIEPHGDELELHISRNAVEGTASGARLSEAYTLAFVMSDGLGIVDTDPWEGSYNEDLEVFTFTFAEPVNVENASHFTLAGGSGANSGVATFNTVLPDGEDDHTVVATLAASLANNRDEITVSIATTAVKGDPSNNVLPDTYTLTVNLIGDLGVDTSVPEHAATDVETTDEIVVTFDESAIGLLDPSGITLTTTGGLGLNDDIGLAFDVQDDELHVLLARPLIEDGSVMELAIADDAVMAGYSGNTLDGTATISFTMDELRVLDSVPVHESNKVGPLDSVRVIFSEPIEIMDVTKVFIDGRSGDDNTLVYIDSVEVDEDAPDTLVVGFSGEFDVNEDELELHVLAGAVAGVHDDLPVNLLQSDAQIDFQLADGLEVVDTVPEHEGHTRARQHVNLLFSEPIEILNIAEITVNSTADTYDETVVSGAFLYNNGKSLDLVFNEPFDDDGDVVTITVAEAALDAENSNNVLGAPFNLQFTMALKGGLTVASSVPAHQATEVGATDEIAVTFAHDSDTEVTLDDASAITVTGGSGDNAGVSIDNVSVDDLVMTITLDRTLAENGDTITYTINPSAVSASPSLDYLTAAVTREFTMDGA